MVKQAVVASLLILVAAGTSPSVSASRWQSFESLYRLLIGQERIQGIRNGGRAHQELFQLLRLGRYSEYDATRLLRGPAENLSEAFFRFDRRFVASGLGGPNPERLNRRFKTLAPTLLRIDQSAALPRLLQGRNAGIHSGAATLLREIVQRDAFKHLNSFLAGWTADWSRTNALNATQLLRRISQRLDSYSGPGRLHRGSRSIVREHVARAILETQGRGHIHIPQRNHPNLAEILTRHPEWATILNRYEDRARSITANGNDLRIAHLKIYPDGRGLSSITVERQDTRVVLDFGPRSQMGLSEQDLLIWGRSIFEAALADLDLLLPSDSTPAHRTVRSLLESDRYRFTPIAGIEHRQVVSFHMRTHPDTLRLARRMMDYQMGLDI